MYEVLFQNSVITLRTFNILLALGLLFAGVFGIRYAEKHKMNLAFLANAFIPLLFAAIVGGRLFYALENYALVKQDFTSLLYLWDLNFSFFGVITGLLTMLYYLCRRNEEDFWGWVDTLVLSLIGVMFFVHLGFFFNGQHYGIPTNLPWGIAFDAPHIPYTIPLHPIQLYAALICLILLAYSVGRSKRIHLSGVVGTRALMLYSLCLLGLDFLRGDPFLIWYTKIAFGILAALSFIATVHCSHKTHIQE